MQFKNSSLKIVLKKLNFLLFDLHFNKKLFMFNWLYYENISATNVDRNITNDEIVVYFKVLFIDRRSQKHE